MGADIIQQNFLNYQLKMKTTLLSLTTLLCLFLLSFPNTAEAQPDDRVYKIRVTASRGTIMLDEFRRIAAYGHISIEPADNGYTRVYLGKYIGRNTALNVLNKIKARGFKTAYLVLDFEVYPNNEARTYSTWQFTSLRKLNFTLIESKLNGNFSDELYIQYANGHYRYSLGVYNKFVMPESEEGFRQVTFQGGFIDGFARTL